jgi:hypothetical protein
MGYQYGTTVSAVSAREKAIYVGTGKLRRRKGLLSAVRYEPAEMTRGTSAFLLHPPHCAIEAIAGALAREKDHSPGQPTNRSGKVDGLWPHPKPTFIRRQRNRGDVQTASKTRIIDRVTELSAEGARWNELTSARRRISENQRPEQLRTAEGTNVCAVKSCIRTIRWRRRARFERKSVQRRGHVIRGDGRTDGGRLIAIRRDCDREDAAGECACTGQFVRHDSLAGGPDAVLGKSIGRYLTTFRRDTKVASGDCPVHQGAARRFLERRLSCVAECLASVGAAKYFQADAAGTQLRWMDMEQRADHEGRNGSRASRLNTASLSMPSRGVVFHVYQCEPCCFPIARARIARDPWGLHRFPGRSRPRKRLAFTEHRASRCKRGRSERVRRPHHVEWSHARAAKRRRDTLAVRVGESRVRRRERA